MKKELLIIGLILFLINPAGAAWSNVSLNYKVPLQINNTGNASTLNNFTFTFTLPYNSNMAADFRDVRVYNDNTGQEMVLWNESVINSTSAIFWFNSTTAISGTAWTNDTFYAYYNNSTVTTKSDGNNTFPFFYSCNHAALNTTIWPVSTGYSESGGNCTTTANSAFLRAAYTFNPVNISLETLSSVNAAQGYYYTRELILSDSTTYAAGNFVSFGAAGTTNFNYRNQIGGGTFTELFNGNFHRNVIQRTNGDYTVIFNGSDSHTITPGSTAATSYIEAGTDADGGGHNIRWIFLRKHVLIDPTITLGDQIGLYSNNITNDQTLTLSVLSNTPIQFIHNGTITNWYINTVPQGTTANNFSYTAAGNNTTTITVNYTTGNLTWTVTSLIYPIELLTPANGSTATSPVTILWREWIANSPHTWQISSDFQFINIIASGTATNTNELFNTTQTLDPGTYYWHVKNSTGSYTDYFIFTIDAEPATPGQLNISARDEITNTSLSTFSAQIYNSTVTLNKSTTTGWVNFSSSEVISGEYLIRVVPNSSYASRSVLATSPANVTVWLPATSNTIDTIAFYLLDYTNKFPWQSSVFELTKNNSVMHSAYFDADAKVATYLIRGDSYGVTIINGNNIQNWGNYISTASGNVEVVIMDIGVNTTLRNPFIYNVTWNTSDITLRWSDSYNVMTSLNFTIEKGSAKTTVHQLITAVDHGTSQYLVTNTSDVYYVTVSALTTNGYRNQSYVIDYRAGTSATEMESSELYTWSYGSVTMPQWVKNAFAILALAMLAGSFGYLHRGEGSILTGIMALIFWKWTWLSATAAGVTFLGSLVLFAFLYHMDSKRKGAYQ